MEPLPIALMILLSFAAATLQGITGFGFAVLLMGFFPILIGVRTANVLVSLVGTAVVLYLFVPLRRFVVRKHLLPVLVGTAVGIPLGVLLLVRLDERVITVSLGVFLIAYLLFELFVRERLQAHPPRWLGYVAGLLGGSFGGAFTSGGPPIVAYLSSLDLEKTAAKATILALIVIASLYKVALLLAYRLVTVEVLRYAAVVLIPAFLGTLVGVRLFRRFSARVFRRIVQGLLLVTALTLILKG
jgi:uncharacterized membrane protein YfcA